MPTNRQMEARDELEAIRNRIKLIREGILDPVEGKAMSRRAPRVWAKAWGEDGMGGRKVPDFHIPAVRPIRPKTKNGVTSFHFGHAAVSKVTRFTAVDGMRNQPGAAKAHGRYVERETAVAHLDRAKGEGLELVPEHGDAVPGERDTVADNQCTAIGSAAVEQDGYLVRDAALAIQPDGSRALLTTISPKDDERADFWELLEEHEGTPNPDTMSFRACHNPAFWAAVLRNPECPVDIRDKLEGPDRDSPEPFVVDSAKRNITFLGAQPGWVTPKSAKKRESEGLGPNMADFVIGRGGRVQYRINAALPAELSLEQNLEVLRDFTKEFEKRDMPHVTVMHAPDQHNDDANWHFHLVYTDRPARRINEADIKQLADKGYDAASLSPGMWDFAVEVPDPKKAGRKRRPLRRNKVPEVSRSKDWPKTLRVALATVVNQHLEAAGVERRVSPDTYAKMGLDIESQDHLGTRQNALETRGKATATGVENERKQWAWIEAQAKARHDAAVADADARVERILRSQSSSSECDKRIQELRAHLYRAAKLRHDAFIVDQEIERSKSRAVMVRERNLKMLNAAKDDPGKVRPAKMKEWQSLIGSATRYLQALEEQLVPEFMAATRWRAEARRCEERASVIQAELARPAEHGQVAERPLPAQTPQSAAQPAARDNTPADPALRAIVAAAMERQRLQRAADEKLMEELLQREREREAATAARGSEASPPDKAQPKRGELEPRQMPPPGSDFGR